MKLIELYLTFYIANISFNSAFSKYESLLIINIVMYAGKT